MDEQENYTPISCVFYDFIEHYAVRGELVDIEINSPEGAQIFKSKILDTQVKDKVEYMLIETPKLSIRMDQIISLNGKFLADFGPRC